ncbi:MAG: hypothetical protein IKG46_11700 [Solobacterium sp.]|nr:hypothetical protein [Solobacterium sp.]
MLKDHEILALRCYEGDVGSAGDPFWSDPKMYVTWNAILFDGIVTEQARTAEKRRLNPSFLEDDERFLDLNRALIDALRRMPKNGIRRAYRVERLADYRVMKEQGSLPSFISTSTGGFLNSYTDKKQLVLMEFEIMPETIYGELGVLLDSYAKQEEAEILLAPYQTVTIEEKPLPSHLAGIRDACGDEPAVYCHVRTGTVIRSGLNSVPEKVYDKEACRHVFAALNAERQPDSQDVQEYLAWKRYIQAQVLRMMQGEDNE